jgi:hypothetical protein
MKQLIKKILKEETEDYQMVSKGIDVVISLVNKTYPFIVGWERANNWDSTKYFFYVNLIVDHKKVKEYYNLPFRDYYEKYPEELENLIKNKTTLAYPTSILDYGLNDDQYDISKKIKETVEDSYELIPNEYKMMYQAEGYLGETGRYYPKEINISYYVFV